MKKKDVLSEVVSFEGEHHSIEVDFAFQFNDGYSENILSFVNNVRTKDGGRMSQVQNCDDACF